MSRSGYSDEGSSWDTIRWRGAVASALRGKRGQQVLVEILAALDVMPEKELIAEALVTPEGKYCTLGVLGAHRGLALDDLDPEDYRRVAKAFDIAPAMAQEILWENDDDWYEKETPAERWVRMRAWIAEHVL